MEQKYIIALEVSDTQAKAACASASRTSKFAVPTIEAIVTEDKDNNCKYGRVQNIIETAQTMSTVLRKIENHPKLKGGRINSAYVALAGRSLGSISSTAALNLPSEMEITSDILNRLFSEATKAVPGDKKVLAVLPKKYTIDGLTNPKPVGSMGTRISGDFTIVTCSNANQRNLEKVLGERLRLPIKDFIVTPLAVAEMALSDEEKQIGCVLVDMGAETTTVSIYKDRALQYLITLPMGSYNVTHDIALGLNLTDDKAESRKQQYGNALPDSAPAGSDDNSQINSYVQARVGEIIANIIAQIEYAKYKPADLSAGFIVTGRGAKLKNFDRALEAQSKLPVRKLSVPATMRVGEAGIVPEDYASIISVANYAALHGDDENCLAFPAAQPEKAPAVAVGAQFDPYGANDEADDDVLVDTEKEGRSGKKGAKPKPAPKPDEEEEEEFDDTPRSGWFEKIRRRMGNIFNDADDADLDDN